MSMAVAYQLGVLAFVRLQERDGVCGFQAGVMGMP